MKILRDLRELHMEKREEITSKRWAKSIKLMQLHDEVVTGPPAAGDVEHSMPRPAADSYSQERENRRRVIQLPDSSEADCDFDVLKDQNSSLPSLPEDQEENSLSPEKEFPELSQAKTESPVPPKLLQDKMNRWKMVRLRSQEKFNLAVAQEKVVLMNRVVGKINYEGRVSVEAIESFALPLLINRLVSPSQEYSKFTKFVTYGHFQML